MRTERVKTTSYEQVIGATGVTEPSQTAIIQMGSGSGIAADKQVVIQGIAVTEGQHVRSGDLLFSANEDVFRLALKQKESSLTAADAQQQALEKLFAQKAASGFELRAAKAKFELAKLEVEIARRDLEHCNVTSPIDGFVDRVDVVPGAAIDPKAELTQVLSLNPIHMRVDVPQEQIGDVGIGQSAEVVIDSFPQEKFQAKVLRISPQVDAETRVLSVVVEIPNSEYRIKSGISGYARFRNDRTALAMPAVAMVQLKSKAAVFVVEDGKAKVREIRTGRLIGTGMKEVVAGLKDGDEVVVYGQQHLQDDDAVDIDWRKWARRDADAGAG